MSTSAAPSAPPPVVDSLADNRAVLGHLLHDCAIELLQDYGVAGLEPQTPMLEAHEGALAGVDFSGSSVRGTLALHATTALVEASYEHATGRAMNDVDAEDWNCELANQLLGRLKNELLRSYGTGFSVNVPRRLWSVSTTELLNARRYAFQWNEETLSVYLDVLFAPGTKLRQQSSPEPIPNEGELLMF